MGLRSPRRQRQLLLHLLMLDKAQAEVDAGTAIFRFTDQSCIDTLTHIRYGCSKPGMSCRFPKGTGVRVAHMHALTAYGLLAVNDTDGKPIYPPETDQIRGERATTIALTAELTFDLKRKGEATEDVDEKAGFSATVCANWVKNRFLPAARAIWKHPTQLYLYMDNCSGHTGRDKTKYWPMKGNGHTRKWNLEGLAREGCTSLKYKGQPKPQGEHNAKFG